MTKLKTNAITTIMSSINGPVNVQSRLMLMIIVKSIINNLYGYFLKLMFITITNIL